MFVGPHGAGNRLGVFIEPGFDPSVEQAVAADLGFSETVFVNDREAGSLRIFTPTVELPFAGHPLIGAAQALLDHARPAAQLSPPAGRVSARRKDGLVWISAPAEWVPPFTQRELSSPAAVDQFPVDSVAENEAVQVWAWQDHSTGDVRTRVFPRAYGIPEDPATGGAAILLCARLRRDLTLTQGPGAELHVRYAPPLVELGGRVAEVEVRPYLP